MSKPKSKPSAAKDADRDLELRKLDAQRVITTRVVEAAVKVAPWICGWLSISSLAGKETDANLFVSVWTDIAKSDATVRGLLVMWAATASALAYHWRALYRKQIELTSAFRTEHQRLIDPRRTSSGLQPNGDTNPKDVR